MSNENTSDGDEKWTDKETNVFFEELMNKVPIDKIALQHKRTIESIRFKWLELIKNLRNIGDDFGFTELVINEHLKKKTPLQYEIETISEILKTIVFNELPVLNKKIDGLENRMCDMKSEFERIIPPPEPELFSRETSRETSFEQFLQDGECGFNGYDSDGSSEHSITSRYFNTIFLCEPEPINL